MSSVKLVAIQVPTTESVERNIEEATRLVKASGKSEPDIICLPEAWLHSKPHGALPKLLGYKGRILGEFSKLAVELGCQILAGGIYVRRAGELRISCPVIGADGSIQGWQDKIHLFGRERTVFSPGRGVEVFDHGAVKFGVLVCHDIVYPELPRLLALRGVDLLFNPSRIVTVGIEPWHLYVSARSLENRLPLVAPNVWIDPLFRGGSVIAKPVRARYSVYVMENRVAPKGAGIVTAAVDSSELRDARQERLSRLNPAMYHELHRAYRNQILRKPSRRAARRR